jgi:hypothetical protein
MNSPVTARRFTRIQNAIPFVMKQRKDSKDLTEHAEYIQSVKRGGFRIDAEPLHYPEEGVDDDLKPVLLENKNTYFVSGLLKVKFDGYFYPGEAFGIRSLLFSGVSQRAVFAVSDCLVLSFSKDDYEMIIEKERSRIK